jgi:hypothetical protein
MEPSHASRYLALNSVAVQMKSNLGTSWVNGVSV